MSLDMTTLGGYVASEQESAAKAMCARVRPKGTFSSSWGQDGGQSGGGAGRGGGIYTRSLGGKGQSDLSVQFLGWGKVFAPNPNDFLARALQASIDAREGGLLLELRHAGRVTIQGSPASLPLTDGSSLKLLPEVCVHCGALHGLAELVIVTEDVCLLDVILLLVLSKIKLFLDPPVSVPATGGLLGLFLRAAGRDGVRVNGKPVSSQSPPPSPKRLAWGRHCTHTQKYKNKTPTCFTCEEMQTAKKTKEQLHGIHLEP